MTLRRGRLAAAIAGAVVVLSAVVGCAGSTPQQTVGLTETQAEQLAVARFRNYDAGVRAVSITVPNSAVGRLTLSGWFDFTNTVGYASLSSDESTGLVWWSADTIATDEMQTETATFPLPTSGWQSGTLDPSATTLSNTLSILANLGSDRPENPQLLQQSDAQRLRADTVDGTKVTVFVGPTSDGASATSAPVDERPTYWLDATGTMLRFQNPLPGGGLATIDFTDATGTITIPTTVPGS